MKKLIVFILVLTTLLSALPFSAAAYLITPHAEYIYIGNTRLEAGQYLASGSTTPVKTKPSGGYAYFQGELFLNNFTFNAEGYAYTNESSVDENGITWFIVKTAAIYIPGNLPIKVTGKNYIKNTYEIPDHPKTEDTIYGYSISDIFTTGNTLHIYGDGSLSINSNDGIISRPEIDNVIYNESVDILCSEFYARNYNICIDIACHVGRTSVNIECDKFNIVSGYIGINVTNGEYAREDLDVNATINFTGGEATIYSLNAICTNDIDDVVGEGCAVNVTDTKLRVYSPHLGIYSNVLNVHSGEVFVDAKNYSLSGLLWLDDSMEVTEGSPFESQFAVAPKNRITADCDVNSDGNVNLFDYTTLKSICVKNASTSESVMEKSDVNEDGKVNIFDYMLVKSRYFNPPMTVSSLEGVTFDLLTEYITEAGYYSSSDKIYSIKATDIVSGTPPFTYALKTDANRSKIIVSASTKNSNGDTISAELTMTKENMVGTVKTIVTGSENLSATSSLIINECCVTELDVVGFACSDTGSYTAASLESETEALIRDALLRIDENWPHELYVSLPELGFMHY